MNKNKWNKLPDNIKKAFEEVNAEFIEKMAQGWNNIDLAGSEFFKSKGGQMIQLTDSEAEKWNKAVAPVLETYTQEMVKAGYSADDMKERLEFIKKTRDEFKTFFHVIGVILMVGITCRDVIGAKLFLLPVPGSIEIISLLQVAAIVFAVAATQRRVGHISVEMFVDSFPKTIRHLTKALVSLCCLVLFTLLIYEGVGLGNEYLEAGEVTATAQTPFFPFAYLFSIALIPIFNILGCCCITPHPRYIFYTVELSP